MQVSNNPFMLIFGAFQIVLSQIPDFDRLWFLSILAAVMSFSYSTIGLGLAIGKTTGKHTLTDLSYRSPLVYENRSQLQNVVLHLRFDWQWT